jgi:pimeloyl-ACP methyl ester carboxylesterase
LRGAEDTASAPTVPASTTTAADGLDRVVKIDGDRGLYVRCTGTGSQTVVMEGGDGDTSDSYAFAEPSLAKVTRTCVYDRANLGRSDTAPGPRGLRELVGDLEKLLEAAKIPGPYVLVGTSGGEYITSGYAIAHPQEVAGMVFIDTGLPLRIRLARSSRRRTRPTRRTPSVVTTCRSRRTRGRPENGSATSPCQSCPSSSHPPRSRSRRSRRSGE